MAANSACNYRRQTVEDAAFCKGSAFVHHALASVVTFLGLWLVLTPLVLFAQSPNPPETTVPQRVRQLEAEPVAVRWYAAYALGRMGPEAGDAVGPLIAVLEQHSQHEHVRGTAAWALGRIGVGSEPVVRVLTETLPSNHISVRRNSSNALGMLGQAAKPAVPGLVTMLADPDVTARVNAAVALWKIQRHPQAVPTLIAVARTAEETGPYQATVALGELGSAEPVVIGALIGSLGHRDADVRRAAVRSLGHIGPPAIAPLKQVLAEGDTLTQLNAVEALGRIGAEAVSALIEAMANQRADVRRHAARALGRLGPAAKTADAALLKAVNDVDPLVRQSAARALKRVRGE